MPRPTSSMWRITTPDGRTFVVDSDTLAWLCKGYTRPPTSIELLRGQAAEDARKAGKID